MGLDEDAWKELIDDALSLAASSGARERPAGTPSTGHELPDGPHLGMEFLMALVEEAEADEGLLVLQRLLRLAERRNPMHSRVTEHGGMDADAEVAAMLHEAPPVNASAGMNPAAASGSDVVGGKHLVAPAGDAACRPTYREWCAQRVAAGELTILGRSLAIVAELVQSAEEALESQSSEESGSDESEVGPDEKRQRV